MEEGLGEKGFEGLASYQHGLRLFDAAYRLAARLPTHERYNLTDQLRRSALSVLLNIAEGYGRYHYLDKLRFFYIARGSLCETLSGFIAAHQAGSLRMSNSPGCILSKPRPRNRSMVTLASSASSSKGVQNTGTSYSTTMVQSITFQFSLTTRPAIAPILFPSP